MVTVEPAAPGDADAVATLWVALAQDQRRHGSRLLAETNRAAVRASIARHAADGGVAVARDGDDVAGFVRFDVDHGPLSQSVKRGIVRDLYVVSGRRGEGIGSRLLDHAEATLRDRGVDVVAVEAVAGNDDAVRFYERRGYRPHRIEFEREVESDKRSGGNR
jgi:ribosomal protein S18 acetylase RimI-like enzyme